MTVTNQRFRKSRYRKQARTIPLRASDRDCGREEIDHGYYYRCWNCGFICKDGRDYLSKDGRRGTTLLEGTGYSGDGDTTLNTAVGDHAYLDADFDSDIVLMKEDSTGSAETVVLPLSVGGVGCPLCHCTAYRKT